MKPAAGSLDVEIRWGASVLHVAHLAPPRSVYVGEWSASCDCLIPAAILGSKRAPLVLVDPDGSIWLVVLPSASVRTVLEDSHARSCPEIRGARMVALPSGAHATMEIGGLEIHVAHDPHGPAAERRLRHDHDTSLSMGFSLVAHAALLLTAALAFPSLNETPILPLWDTTPYMITPRVETFTEVEPDAPIIEPAEAGNPDDRPIANSRCSDENGGTMGDPAAGGAQRRYGVQGPADNPDPHVARSAAWPDGPWESFIGITPRNWGGDPRAPLAPWGRDDSLGNDARSARGNMWGNDIGAAFGSPGAGVGLRELCETCGGNGRGARSYPTEEGGPTLTESTCDLAFPLIKAR